MKATMRVVALLAIVPAGVLGARRLFARSNTQVHRINQDKPLVTQKESRT